MNHRHSLLFSLAFLIAAAASPARAHFPFIVPDDGAASARMVFSETLQPADEVEVELVKDARLRLRAATGTPTRLKLTPETHSYTLRLPGEGDRVINGIVDLGVMQRGKGKANHLLYHPKTLVGDPFRAWNSAEAETPVELVPVRSPEGVRLRAEADGRAMPGAEVVLVLPDQTEERVKTGDDGLTPPLPVAGRYGAWTRLWLDTPGELDGKPYEQVRHYATLVFDNPEAPSAPVAPTPRATASALRLPYPAASFGAVESGGWLYVYGGHITPRHEYSVASVTGRFCRVRLEAESPVWEELPPGPPVQGMNLAAWKDRVIRVGGMQPRNAEGQPEDNHSLDDAAVFDPATGAWTALPPLPVKRSSHDLAVVGDRLYVLGGWSMPGGKEDPEWLDVVHVLDLAAEKPAWTSLPQPFHRRALIAAVRGTEIFVLGGFDESDQPHRTVSVLDTATGVWRDVAPLPGEDINGFAPASCVVDGRLLASVGTGETFRLSPAGDRWDLVLHSTPRIVHRMVARNGTVYLLGGATRKSMQDLIETAPAARLLAFVLR